MLSFAPIITHGDLDGNLSASTESIYVYGIVVANIDTTDTFEVTFSDQDSTTKLSISVQPGQTIVSDVPFLADNGFKADTLGATDGPTCKVTIFHSQGAA